MSMETVKSDALTLEQGWHMPDRGMVGVAVLIITETVAVHDFRGRVFGLYRQEPERADAQRRTGPAGAGTICLLSSSLTIVFAEHALKKGHLARSSCGGSRLSLLGLEFLTARGWSGTS